MRRFAVLCLVVLCLFFLGAAQADEASRVFRVGEKAPFSADAAIFDLYVCPLLGADCMVLTFGEQIMLVDMGKANDYETIKSVLTERGIDHIDIAFNTHPHTDHLGSMKQILTDYPVGVFMTAFPENYTDSDVIQISTLRAVREAGVPVETVQDGTQFMLGDARMTVIRQTKYSNPNPLSAMLKVEYGECSLLLCADVIGSAQLELAETHDLKADIFKFPHHGLNKVMREFLEDIDPEYAFFTHGYANTTAAQEQLTAYGIPHDFATWGVIHLSTDGTYWLVEQTLNENGVRYAQKFRPPVETESNE